MALQLLAQQRSKTRREANYFGEREAAGPRLLSREIYMAVD